MLEVVILAAVVIALYRRHGEHWEWNRTRVQRAFTDLSGDGARAVAGMRTSSPGLLSQCIADVRSLIQDMLAVLNPSARRRIERGASRWLARPTPVTVAGPELQAATVGAHPPRTDAAYAGLQKRYLAGRISLDEYVEQADRLQDEETA